MAQSKTAQEEDALFADYVRNAREFTTCLHLGPGNRTTVRGLPTYKAAMAKAAELNTQSQYGRKAIVYAVSQQGYTIDVSPRLAALAGVDDGVVDDPMPQGYLARMERGL
jgi:hypothetical protein